MNDSDRKLLPHEACFVLFLLVTWLRLVCAVGPFDAHALAWLAGLGLNVTLCVWARRRATPAAWRACLFFYPIAMNVYYGLLGGAVPKLQVPNADALLQRWDAALIGSNLSVRLQPFVHPVLTEFFSGCYFLFFVFLAFSMINYIFCAELALARRFCAGLFTLYGLGFIGYTLLPAQGPWLALAGEFHTPLTGWAITHLNDAVVCAGSNRVDVFPSLHCAVSLFLLGFDRWHRPWRYRLYFVPCVGLWVSTIYLRYHYFVDCVCGLAFATVVLALLKPKPSASHERLVPV
jgi:hypothetical protein